MLDTVNFKITQAEVEGINFLEVIPPHLNPDTLSLHNYRGDEVVTGFLENLKVSISKWQVKIGDGSLCKFVFGDNFHTMQRADIKRAVEAISDSLHIPITEAVITRLDLAENIIVKHPPKVYLNHLGVMPLAKRLANDGSLYYTKRAEVLCFYDKVREQKAKREPIPELYQSSNVLRYEQRYMGRLGEAFKVESVRGSILYDERFYIELLNRWQANYRAIKKINDITPNFDFMKGKKEFALLGKLSYIEQMGGEVAMMEQIAEAQRQGKLTKKQALDLREDIKNTCKERESLTTKSEAITELDKKIAEAIRFYR